MMPSIFGVFHLYKPSIDGNTLNSRSSSVGNFATWSSILCCVLFNIHVQHNEIGCIGVFTDFFNDQLSTDHFVYSVHFTL